MGAAVFVGRSEMVSFSSSDYHEVSHFCWQFGKRSNQVALTANAAIFVGRLKTVNFSSSEGSHVYWLFENGQPFKQRRQRFLLAVRKRSTFQVALTTSAATSVLAEGTSFYLLETSSLQLLKQLLVEIDPTMFLTFVEKSTEQSDANVEISIQNEIWEIWVRCNHCK